MSEKQKYLMKVMEKRSESRGRIMKPFEPTLKSSPLCNNEWIVKLFKQRNETVTYTFLEGLFCQLKKMKTNMYGTFQQLTSKY